jgi:hypothetical protein
MNIFLAILFCSSIQLLTVDTLREYLAKVYNESKRRPTYVISEEG